MPADKTKPLELQIAFKSVLNDCKTLVRDNSDIINLEVEKDSMRLSLSEAFRPSSFQFSLSEPFYQNTLTLTGIRIAYSHSPASVKDSKLTGFNCAIDGFRPVLQHWIDLVRSYNEFSYETVDDMATQYADKYYLEFKSNDEDAETAPFEDDKQLLIIKQLAYLVEAIKDIPDPTGELSDISDAAASLKNEQQRLPKNWVLKRYSRIMGKLRILAPDVLQLIFKTGIDQIFKEIWHSAIEHILHIK